MNLISQTSEYALRAMVHLASVNERASVREISERIGVPSAYLGKVLKELVRAGLVSARRGPGGGVALAKAADEISVLDVVNAVDPVEHVRRCPLWHREPAGALCPLHRHIEDAITHVEREFGSTMLADLALVGHHAICPRGEDSAHAA